MKKVNCISLILILYSCSFLQASIPRLQDRTLLISLEGPYLEYPYYKTVCKNPSRIIFKNCSEQRFVDKYDLSDPVTRKQLVDMGFVAQSKMRFVY